MNSTINRALGAVVGALLVALLCLTPAQAADWFGGEEHTFTSMQGTCVQDSIGAPFGWMCAGNIRWRKYDRGITGPVKLVGTGTGECIGLENDRRALGTRAVLAPCKWGDDSTGDTQYWSLYYRTSSGGIEYYSLVNLNADGCLQHGDGVWWLPKSLSLGGCSVTASALWDIYNPGRGIHGV
jgi:hypothetical protein